MIETLGGNSVGMADDACAATVALIISSYNRAHLIGETIDSILAQSRVPNELIIVNDGHRPCFFAETVIDAHAATSANAIAMHR